MRGIVIGAAVLFVLVVAAILLPYALRGDLALPRANSTTTFTVDGHAYSCGPDSSVTLTVGFSYPGPTHGAHLDGVTLPDEPSDSPGGAYFPVTAPTVLSCTEHRTHRIRLDLGRSTEHYVGCSIELAGSPISGEGQVTSGKNVTPVTNRWQASDTVCDVTWRT